MSIDIQPGRSEPNPHKPGDKFGKLTIQCFLARSAQNLNTGRWLHTEHNWYQVRCDCGRLETVNQPVLTPSGRRQCLECCAEDKARHISAARHQTVEALPVPDFARMKW